MDIGSKGYKDLLARRPLNVQVLYGNEPLGLVSGRDIATSAKETGTIVLAGNARNALIIKGLLKAAHELNSSLLIELAKSEDSYCGTTYDNVADYAMKYSAELGHGVIFALHVDHYAIKGKEDLMKGAGHLTKIITNGFTSVAIDASHLDDYANLAATRDLGTWLPSAIGLEAEVGEIKGAGELTTVEEALYFIGGLNAWGVFPDYLAISNGSLHGTYDPAAGVIEGIDLVRTKEIADAVAPYGVSIAQHGISGTPFSKVSQFSKFGINKGNVATLFQNVVFGIKMDPETGNAVTEGGTYIKESDRGISDKLWNELVHEADSKGIGRKSGDYKKLNLPFHAKILAEPDHIVGRIVDEVSEWAKRFIKAFGGEGTAEHVLEVVSRRRDHNSSPERVIRSPRAKYGPADAPNQTTGKGGNFDD
ncbi:MAG: class II fructose-bisphosphate aldolase [Synergistaceae bacterium]|jgi:fructose/tagatose bisphosphate aldolase|nr:class II fructose-bisphosphate aldolase [Synergistaceae bacterium]